MNIFNDIYRNDPAISSILSKNPKEPHTVVYQGGPWHGKREPYDPEKKEMRVAEPFPYELYASFEPNPKTCSELKIIRYIPKVVSRRWAIHNSRRVISGRVAVGCNFLGKVIYEPTYEQITERITFSEYGIAMVAENWKKEPIIEEKDCYGRNIVHILRMDKDNDNG